MNILYLAPIVPWPLIDGDRQRCYHLLKALSEKHDVHLLCFYRDEQEAVQLEHLKSICKSVEGILITKKQIRWNALKSWFTSKPLNVAAFQHGKMKKRVSQLIKEYAIHAVHAYRLRMLPYALQTEKCYRVIDYTDAMVRYFKNRKLKNKSWIKSLYLNREIKTLGAYEGYISNYTDASIISSPQDQQELIGLRGATWIKVITNGVDTRSFRYIDTLVQEPVILFVGNMHYVPNTEGVNWFCSTILPRLKQKQPNLQFWVVGKAPDGTNNEKHDAYEGALFKGLVPDLNKIASQARVAVCPVSIASGRQFKVIEYFSFGLPTVTTSLVADNLNAKDETHILVADQPQQFADKVETLLTNLECCNRIREQARALAEKEYDWSGPAKALQKIYFDLESASQVEDQTQKGSLTNRMKEAKSLRFRSDR